MSIEDDVTKLINARLNELKVKETLNSIATLQGSALPYPELVETKDPYMEHYGFLTQDDRERKALEEGRLKLIF